jgi:hypothetical protein
MAMSRKGGRNAHLHAIARMPILMMLILDLSGAVL